LKKEKDRGKEERPEKKSYHPSALTEKVYLYLSDNCEITLSAVRRQRLNSYFSEKSAFSRCHLMQATSSHSDQEHFLNFGFTQLLFPGGAVLQTKTLLEGIASLSH